MTGSKDDREVKLMEINARLVKSVAELTATNANLVKQLGQLAGSLAKLEPAKRGQPRGWDGEEKQRKYCKNCKRMVFHKPDRCLELERNADKRRKGWKDGRQRHSHDVRRISCQSRSGYDQGGLNNT